MGLGVGRLDQLLQDDAVKEAIAPDAILQVNVHAGEGNIGG